MIASFSTHLRVPGSFTDRFEELEDSVNTVQADGLTAFNDSMYELANDDFDAPALARKVVVVITDGNDSVSRRSFREAMDSVLRNNVTVYTISVRDRKSLYPAECLSEMSASTGGHSYELKNLKNLKSAFEQIDDDLRSYYVAAYRAPDYDKTSFHALTVQLAAKGLNVQNKKGYFRTE